MTENVTVVFTSGGQNWVPLGLEGTTGKMLKQKIVQVEINAKVFPDPVDNPEMKHVMGTEQRAQEFVLGNDAAQKWLNTEIAKIIEVLEGCDEACVVHVAVRCRGGFQRSVTIVEALAALLRKAFSDQPIIVAHLTLPLVLFVRQQHFGVNVGDQLLTSNVVRVLP